MENTGVCATDCYNRCKTTRSVSWMYLNKWTTEIPSFQNGDQFGDTWNPPSETSRTDPVKISMTDSMCNIYHLIVKCFRRLS